MTNSFPETTDDSIGHSLFRSTKFFLWLVLSVPFGVHARFRASSAKVAQTQRQPGHIVANSPCLSDGSVPEEATSIASARKVNCWEGESHDPLQAGLTGVESACFFCRIGSKGVGGHVAGRLLRLEYNSCRPKQSIEGIGQNSEIPVNLRREMEEKLGGFEIAVAVVGGLIVFVATMAAPPLNRGTTRAELAMVNARQEQQIAELGTTLEVTQQERDELRFQWKQARAKLEQACSELAVLKREHETLDTRLTAANEEIKKLKNDLKVQELKAELEVKNREAADERVRRAEERKKKAEDQVRELTLQLHRAGVLP